MCKKKGMESCESGWSYDGGNCYKIFDEWRTWYNSKVACRQIGADLASITSSEEQQFVAGLALQGYWDVTGVCMGATQHIWAWSDGQPWWDEIKWGSGNPNNWYGNEDCGEIWPNSDKGDFNDKDCSTELPHLCQKKANTATTTSSITTTTSTTTTTTSTTTSTTITTPPSTTPPPTTPPPTTQPPTTQPPTTQPPTTQQSTIQPSITQPPTTQTPTTQPPSTQPTTTVPPTTALPSTAAAPTITTEVAAPPGTTAALVVADAGGWGDWQAWGSCTHSCGGDRMFRSRFCDDPVPSPGGLPCFGNVFEISVCNAQSCPVYSSYDYYGHVCPSRYFPCQGGDVTCIPQEYRCDCNNDCTDGSDETAEWALCTREIIFYCTNKAIGVAPGFLLPLLSIFTTVILRHG